VCSFKCKAGYTPRSVTDFPPVAERDGWDAKDGKDPGDVGLLKCERGSMYDAHELTAGGTKKDTRQEEFPWEKGGGGLGECGGFADAGRAVGR
jgi:hypothetical protein